MSNNQVNWPPIILGFFLLLIFILVISYAKEISPKLAWLLVIIGGGAVVRQWLLNQS